MGSPAINQPPHVFPIKTMQMTEYAMFSFHEKPMAVVIRRQPFKHQARQAIHGCFQQRLASEGVTPARFQRLV